MSITKRRIDTTRHELTFDFFLFQDNVFRFGLRHSVSSIANGGSFPALL